MTDTEKLIELLYSCPDCRMLAVSEVQRIANYLVYHGVTVMEKGEWVDGICSRCGCLIPEDDAVDAIFKDEVYYCPNCGSDMRKEKR